MFFKYVYRIVLIVFYNSSKALKFNISCIFFDCEESTRKNVVNISLINNIFQVLFKVLTCYMLYPRNLLTISIKLIYDIAFSTKKPKKTKLSF